MGNDLEKLNPSPENNLEKSGEAAKEQLEKLGDNYENTPERQVESAERKAERARIEALENAASVEAGGAEKIRDNEPSRVPRHSAVSKKDMRDSYNRTMAHVQSEMSAPERVFSKVIHNPLIEKTSETVGNTIARPNAILAGSISAFIITFCLYLIAKRLGYPLSGFETIGAFILGWALGILFDYFKVMITGKR